MIMEATIQQYFVSSRFDYFLRILLNEFYNKPVWVNPYATVIFQVGFVQTRQRFKCLAHMLTTLQAKRFALGSALSKRLHRKRSGFAKSEIVPVGNDPTRAILWRKKVQAKMGIFKLFGHESALEYCNPQVRPVLVSHA